VIGPGICNKLFEGCGFARVCRTVADTPVRLFLTDMTAPPGRFQPPSAQELRLFRDALNRCLGQPVVRRYSGGKYVQAASGTLVAAE
jgi:23S rRNA (adenine2503-C2)-methyltransferase